jgi:hypothetical protein
MNTDDDWAEEPKRGRPMKRKKAARRGGCEAGVSSSTDAKKANLAVSCASWQYDDTAQPHLRLQTKAVRADLLERLMSQEHYVSCGDEMVRNNGGVVKLLKRSDDFSIEGQGNA